MANYNLETLEKPQLPYFQTPEGNIYYEQHGQTGPVVFLLHGLGSSSRIWLRQVRDLQKNCQVYVIDLPGHGRSEHWKHYSFSALSDLLNSFMEHFQISTACLVGLSLGCTVALTFAVRHPDRVDGLVLEGPTAGYGDWWHPWGWADQFVFRFLPLALHISVKAFGHHATAQWLNTFGVKRKRNIKTLENLQSKADYRAVYQLLSESASPPYVGKLKEIKAPALIIRGCNDPMPKRFVQYIQSHIQKASLIEVPDTRHLVALERPRAFNQLVQDFIQQNLPALTPETACVSATS